MGWKVLSTVPVMFNYDVKPEDTLDLSKILNDHIASAVKQHPLRFVGSSLRLVAERVHAVCSR